MARSPSLHPAWIVLGALTLCMLAASGLRATFGVYIKPMEAELGWSRAALSGAAAVSLFFLGAAAPFVGWLADRWGPRRVIGVSLIALAAGAVGTSFVGALWQMYITAVLMALGAGGAATSVGAAVIARWFETRRGFVLGIAGGAMSAGQLIVVPLAAGLTVWLGWRPSLFWLGLGVLVLVLPISVALIRDTPEDQGVRPYGATGPVQSAAQLAAQQAAERVSVVEAARTPQFWLLMGTFFVCGYTAVGMVQTHFMPHALEGNFTEFQASAALGVMGAMNIVGTISSGWFCDRFGRRGPLATYYFVRGLSLVYLLYVSGTPSLMLWAVIFGLNYVSTYPPTTTLTANIFGRFSVGVLSGWVLFAHQVGAALGAALAGWLYEWAGNYSLAFSSAAVLALLAAGMALAIREEPVRAGSTSIPTPVPAIS